MTKIIPISVEPTIPQQVTNTDDNRDWVMARTMMSYAKQKPQRGIIPLNTQSSVTKNTSIMLVLFPPWGLAYPPYNLSRLSGVTNGAGFKTKVYDLNIAIYHEIKEKSPVDLWDPARDFYWLGELYEKEVHPLIEPIIKKYMEEIAASNPTVVGFTLYYSNEQSTNWAARYLRTLLPTCKIILGGPHAPNPSNPATYDYYDHIFKGEAEQTLLDFLNSIENREDTQQIYAAPPTRLDLDSLPMPDYSQYDMSLYQLPNAISAELSRGCVAKCVFCTEVHFWKYRGRQAHRIVDEIEFQYKNNGIDYVWFIDSLLNGNLKELRAMALGLVERNIDIGWQGYARCDGRMDLSYFTDLATSGCKVLNFGIESGSNKVLKLMKKGITTEAIENNMRDSAAAGINNATLWLIGFVGEQPQDFADTLTCCWRIQDYNHYHLSPGYTLQLGDGAEITENAEKFGISECHFMRAWTTEALDNTKLHRLIRLKTFLTFLQILPNKTIRGIERKGLRKMYTFAPDSVSETKNVVDYEIFDYNIIKPNLNPVADTVVNEIWPLLRTLWRGHGGYEINIRFDPKEDAMEWGYRLACEYTANYWFKIDNDGNWTAKFSFDFVQTPEFPGFHGASGDMDTSFKMDWNESGKW